MKRIGHIMNQALHRLSRRRLRKIPALMAYIVSAVLLPSMVSAQFSSLAVEIEGPPALRTCMTCHGAYGQGNPAVGGPKLAGMESWYLRRQLENFRRELRGTQLDYIPGYEMRDAAIPLSDNDIDAIIMAVSGWPDREVAGTVGGDTANGQTLYQGCSACHGAGGEGNEAVGAPALAGRNDWYLLKQLKLYKSGYRGSHPDDQSGAQMRLMVQGLGTVTDMQDVVAYINTLN